MRFTFPKSEKLTNKSEIEALFKSRQSVFVYPFKVVYRLPDRPVESTPCDPLRPAIPAKEPVREFPKVLISVPKKSFKKAVDRNRIKRQIREVYRLAKPEWVQEAEEPVQALGILYVGKKMEDSSFMEKRFAKVLRKLVELANEA